jgi:hypothetical protein
MDTAENLKFNTVSLSIVDYHVFVEPHSWISAVYMMLGD